MRSLLIVLFCALACLASLAGTAICDDAGKNEFFNSKDFEGWEGLMDYWSIKDGALVGTAPADGLKFNTFLCSKKKYKDFELTFQIQLKDGKGNSGVQIRSEIF